MDPTGAPATESEITPEMIEAGMLADVAHDEFFESRAAIVAHIYRGMEIAKKTLDSRRIEP